MESSQSPNTINNNNTEMSNKNDLNGKESHNRNLTIKEIYNIFGPLMITHKLIELDDDFKKYIMLDSISLAQEEKKLISREISDKITAEIKKHDYVFIKLNSKSAIDSEFACVQLKCFNLDEILVLIKASERMYKVFNPYGQNYLILKPWYKIEHKNEFRCYLVNKRLKGISQRYIDSFEDYDDIDKIRECIIEYIFSKEMKDILDKIEIDENDLHYMIIDLVYMPKKNRVKIVDVETLIEGGDILYFNENIETISDNKDMNTIEHKNYNVNPTSNKKDKKKVNSQEMQQEEEAKKLKKEEEEKERKLFMENFANKKINFDEKIKLFTIDDLLNVDDEDESEIELRIIESTDDPRIVPEPENTNKFPIELMEYDNNIDELIKKLNLK